MEGGGRRRMLQKEEMGEIKKGPWKAEEDQVLINHVRKSGPRDWSSIRSKGLLRRTGKSCRLRWVNKLRPDLKTGVKFSTEEEKTVIDLQAQFGNKWARIATYLPGRTDNDIKNFWSSKQKRLARMLHTSSSSSTATRPHTNQQQLLPPIIAFHDQVPSLEAPKFIPSAEEEEELLAESQSQIDNPETIKLVPFLYPTSSLDYTPPEEKPIMTPEEQQQQHSHLSFPEILQPDFPLPLERHLSFPEILQPDFPLPLERQDEIIAELGDPNFLDDFENSGPGRLPIMPSIFEPQQTGCCDAVDIDSLIDDFPPMDMFDHIPSPSEWP